MLEAGGTSGRACLFLQLELAHPSTLPLSLFASTCWLLMLSMTQLLKAHHHIALVCLNSRFGCRIALCHRLSYPHHCEHSFSHLSERHVSLSANLVQAECVQTAQDRPSSLASQPAATLLTPETIISAASATRESSTLSPCSESKPLLDKGE